MREAGGNHSGMFVGPSGVRKAGFEEGRLIMFAKYRARARNMWGRMISCARPRWRPACQRSTDRLQAFRSRVFRGHLKGPAGCQSAPHYPPNAAVFCEHR